MNKALSEIILASVALAGCATPPPMTPLNTPSGRPEVHISRHSQSQIIDGIIEACTAKGAMIENQTTSTVTCSSGNTSFRAKLEFMPSRGTLKAVNQFIVTAEGDGYRLALGGMWYEPMNAYGASTRSMLNITAGPVAADAQAMMERIAVRINEKPQDK